MKKLTYILMGFFFIFATACEEIETPFPQFEDLEYGAYARRIGPVAGEFNYFNVAGSAISFEVEFYDENKGKNVASYSWTVSYIDRTNNGANNKAAVPLVTVPASAFVVNANGLPGTKITFTFQQVLTALGLTIGGINGGDTFEFLGTVTKTDGTSYSFSNTDANLINQPAFQAMVFLRQNVVCPSELQGTFDYVHTDMFCEGEITGTVTWTRSAAGIYKSNDFAFGSWDHCYGPGSGAALGSLSINDACGKISLSGADQFGDTYTYTILKVDGTALTIKWENTYGEFGTVTLTRQDGKNWPALRN